MHHLYKSLILVLCFCAAAPAQWIQKSNGMPLIGGSVFLRVNAVHEHNGKLYALSSSGVYVSGDLGENWTAQTTGMGLLDVRCMLTKGDDLFAGATTGMFRSTNDGTTWTAINTGLPPFAGPLSIFQSNGTLFIGIGNNGEYTSADDGAPWVKASTGIPVFSGFLFLTGFHLEGAYMFTGMNIYGIYRSTPADTAWSAVNNGIFSPSSYSVTGFASDASNVYAIGTAGSLGVFRTTNNGTTWTNSSSGLPLSSVQTGIFIYRDELFVSTFSAGVYRSTDHGATFSAANTGLVRTTYGFCASGGYLFTGTTTSGVWRRSLSEVTSVERVDAGQPSSFELRQNYPNPFNPTTHLRFTISDLRFVSLKVYNILGAEVATLVHEMKESGNYSVAWDASGLPSGVYLARLTSGGQSDVRRVVLMK